MPKLGNFCLCFDGEIFDDLAFVRMVQSRWLPDSEYATMIGMNCLRSVVLKFSKREVEEEVYRPLQDLDRMGMSVVIAEWDQDIMMFSVLHTSQ